MHACRISIIIAVFVFIAHTSAKGISSLVVDSTSSTIYIAERYTPHLFEVDSGTLSLRTSFVISFDDSVSVESNSLALKKQDGVNYLYMILNSNANTELYSISTPITSVNYLPNEHHNIGLTVSAVYDSVLDLLFVRGPKKISLVDMSSRTVLDSVELNDRRWGGVNVVFNHNTNRLIYFFTRVAYGANANWGLSVNEYNMTGRKFVEVHSEYDCQCEANPASSPFYRTILGRASCEVDYANNNLWCADPKGQRLLVFSDDLSEFSILNTTVDFTTIVFDFASNKAYAILEDGLTGYAIAISAIDLSNGAILSSFTHPTMKFDPYVRALDTATQQLYVAVTGADTTEFAVFDTNTMALKAVVTLEWSDAAE